MYPDQQPRPRIIQAILEHNLEVLKECLTVPENLDIPDSGGFTPLVWAALCGHTDFVKLLKEREATTNLKTWRSHEGSSLLHIAASGGSFRGVQYLLRNIPECGELINEVNRSGATPKTLAAIGGYGEIVKLLHDHGDVTELNYINEQGNSLLHLAAREGSLAGVQYLLNVPACRALINEVNGSGATPKVLAAMFGHGEIVKLLKEQGDETKLIDWRSQIGGTLLQAATRSGLLAGVRYLLNTEGFEKCIDFYGQGQGAPALFIAVEKENLEIVKCLLAAAASPTCLYNGSEIKFSQHIPPFTPTPVQKEIRLLLEAAEELLDLASGKQTKRSLEDLLALGISVNLRNAEGKTLLHLAAVCGYEELIAKILKKGGDLNSKDNAGVSVLETMSQFAKQRQQYHVLANRSLDEAQKAYENKKEKEAQGCVDRAMKYVEETEKTADAFCAQGLYILGMRLKNDFHCFEGAARAFRQVCKGTPAFPEAQWELANMYLVELGVPEKDRVETAYLHIHEAGEDAAPVRTRIMGMLLGKGFEENDIDPKTACGALALMKQLAESTELNRKLSESVKALSHSVTPLDVCEDEPMPDAASTSTAPVTPAYSAVKPRENLQKRKSLPRVAKERASKKIKK